MYQDVKAQFGGYWKGSVNALSDSRIRRTKTTPLGTAVTVFGADLRVGIAEGDAVELLDGILDTICVERSKV